MSESQKERLEKYMNADKMIVSKHGWIIHQIYQQHRENAGSGEETNKKEYIGKTAEYDGLQLYEDEEGELWAGDEHWVIPIKIDFKED